MAVTGKGQIAVIAPDGTPGTVAEDRLDEFLQKGYQLESREGYHERLAVEKFESSGAQALTALEGGARGLTLGLSDVLATDLGADPNELAERKSRNPVTSTASEIAGVLAPALLSGGAGAAGAAARATPAGIVGRLGGAASRRFGLAAGGAVEGTLLGVGTGVSELALDESPLTAERVVSAVGSNALYGGLTGGLVGAGAGLLKKGAEAARGLASKAAETGAGVSDDLARMGPRELRAAQKAETAALEAEKTAQKATIADELKALRSDSQGSKWWVHNPDKEAGKIAFKGDKRIHTLLDAPQDIPDNLRSVRTALRHQETGISKFLEKADEMKASALKEYGAEAASKSARWRAVETAEGILKRNQELQGKLNKLLEAPSSARLTEIGGALDNLAMGGKPKLGLGGEVVKGGVFGGMMAIASPVLGPWAGGLLAGKAAGVAEDLILSRLGSKLAKGGAEQAAKLTKAVDSFLNVAEKGSKAATPAVTKTLTSVSFATPEAVAASPQRPKAPTKNPRIQAFRDREREILAQTQLGPTGKPQMTWGARKELHETLAGVWALNPKAGDALEAVAARKIEYLADKLPKRPQAAGLPIGPDRWQPSEMQVASFARTVAAVEDPVGVIDRMTNGTATREDAEALKMVYPEIYADMQRQIIERLPELRETLPYARRLTMSIIWGVPVDPAMQPNVLAVLQGTYKREAGGGSSAPAPKQPRGTPKSLEKPTPAQEHAG